jgi:hypothetical protein
MRCSLFQMLDRLLRLIVFGVSSTDFFPVTKSEMRHGLKVDECLPLGANLK